MRECPLAICGPPSAQVWISRGPIAWSDAAICPATVVGRGSQAGVGTERLAVGEAAHERFSAQYGRALHTDTVQACKLLNHLTGRVGGTHTGQNHCSGPG